MFEDSNTAVAKAHEAQAASVNEVLVELRVPDTKAPLRFLRTKNLTRH
jgi:hypothetical protein